MPIIWLQHFQKNVPPGTGNKKQWSQSYATKTRNFVSGERKKDSTLPQDVQSLLSKTNF